MPEPTEPDGSEGGRARMFTEFPDVSTEEWEACIEADLKDRSYEDVLIWQPDDRLSLRAYYRAGDLADLPHLASHSGSADAPSGAAAEHPQPDGSEMDSRWTLRQDILLTPRAGGHPDGGDAAERAYDVAAARRRVAEAVESGVEVVGLRLEARPNGRSLPSVDELKSVVGDIDLSALPLHLDAGEDSLGLLDVVRKAAPGLRIETTAFDPVAAATLSDADNQTWRESAAAALEYPSGRLLCADSTPYHERGSGLVDETALMLGALAEYLAELSELGYAATHVAERIHVTLSVGPSYFLEIARLRAVRLLVEHILRAFGTSPPAACIPVHAITSRRNLTLYDRHTNLLRATTAAASAVIGGCDVLVVRPFDELEREPSSFGERLARNMQHLLRHEAYLDKVADPAAGSYYVEKLTDMIARRTWSRFQEIEAAGGLLEASRQGIVSEWLDSSARGLLHDVAVRRRVLIGTNRFPNTEETRSDTLQADAQEYTERTGRDADADRSRREADVPGRIGPFRAAEPFESIRLRTERYAAHTGRTPEALILPIGAYPKRDRRASFAAESLRCAGFRVEIHDGADTVSAAAPPETDHTDVFVVADGDVRSAPNVIHEVDKFISYTAIGLTSSAKADAGVDVLLFSGVNLIFELSRLQAVLGMGGRP